MPIKKLLKWRGLSIGIEYAPGDVRFAGTDHEKVMPDGLFYGHIRGHVGNDGEALDVYLYEPGLNLSSIFELHQLTFDGEFDELKVFIGCKSADWVKKLYTKVMPSQLIGGIVETNLKQIRSLQVVIQPSNEFKYTATESVGGLPRIVEVRGPKKRLSLNGRNWLDHYVDEDGAILGLLAGCAKSRDLIAKGEQLKVRYSHPKDDPEITGLESAGHLLDIGIDPITDEFYAVIELHLETEDGRAVARRFAAKDMPAFSFRARVWCTNQEKLTGDCVPKPGHPVLLDFLRPYELPGIPGSQGSCVVESYECPDKSDCDCDDCQSTHSHLATENLTPTLKTPAGAKTESVSGKKRKGDKSMSKVFEEMLLEVAAEPDQATRDKMAAWGGKILKALPMGSMSASMPIEAETMEEEEGTENKGDKEEKKPGDMATESRKPSPKSTIKSNPSPKPQPQTRPKAEPITDDEAAESLGMDVTAFKIMKAESSAKAQKLSLKSDLDKALVAARSASGDGLLFGFPIRDQKEKFPSTAVESYITAAAAKCSDLAKAEGFITARLEDLANGKGEATESADGSPNPALKGNMHIGKEYWRNAPDKTALEDINKIETAVLDFYKEYDPQKYREYETNKGTRKRAHDQAQEEALEQYGPRIQSYKPANSTATEDINPVGQPQVPNFAKVMTAIMGLRYWIPSPMRKFFGMLPTEAMRLGPMLDNGDGIIGQFVEVMTEIRDQRQVFDAAYYQLPSDIQREIGFRHGYAQYFAFQESTRFRTDSETEFFMGLPPLGTKIPARGIANLFAEMDLFDEQRGSTVALRASDAYKSITLGTPETTNMAITSHRAYSASGGITTPDGTYIKNAIGWVKLRRGQSSTQDPLEMGPIMRPGVRPVWRRENIVSVQFEEEYPVVIQPINGKVQVRGVYNPETQMGENINDRDGEITFLLLPDEGVVVFLVGSRFDLSHGPVFEEYTWVDNYDVFDFGNGGNDIEKSLLGNHFFELLGAMRAVLEERAVPANLIDFLVIPSVANETVANFATHLQGQNRLQYAGVTGNYQSGIGSETAYFRNMEINGSSEPLFRNRLRGLMGTSRLVVVQELGAPELGAKLPGGGLDTNGQFGWNSQWSQSLTRRHFMHAVPRRNPLTGEAMEFGLASLYLQNLRTIISRLPR